jgi:queuine/archaeosine tRNA-ribosyltransferase
LRLATIHNVHYMVQFMAQIREAIRTGRFADFRAAFWEGYSMPNQSVRHEQRRKREEQLRGGAS